MLLPKLRELRGDDVLVRYIAGENADVAAELVHSGNERLRDRRIWLDGRHKKYDGRSWNRSGLAASHRRQDKSPLP